MHFSSANQYEAATLAGENLSTAETDHVELTHAPVLGYSSDLYMQPTSAAWIRQGFGPWTWAVASLPGCLPRSLTVRDQKVLGL